MRRSALAAVLLVALTACSPAPQDAPSPSTTAFPPSAPGTPLENPSELLRVDSATRSAVVEAAAAQLRSEYVFPDRGEKAAMSIEDHLAAGDYDELDQGLAFARRLTDQLQQSTGDQHLTVTFHPPVPAGMPAPGQQPPGASAPARPVPGGVSRVDTLDDNVGVIAIDEFPPPNPDTLDTVAETMRQVADTDSLVFDLRDTRGGSPGTVAVWCSYLLGPDPVQLETFRGRDGKVQQQLTTHAQVDGPVYREHDVFVLTSADTFSGGEQMAYDLKHLDRATIVGATTAGAANVVTPTPLTHTFDLGLPHARPVNPQTGTNWEGTGVSPDVDVPAEKALDVALDRTTSTPS